MAQVANESKRPASDDIYDEDVYDVVIIGGGPAGLSAAIYAARANLKTVVLDKNPTASALGLTRKMENYPGIPLVISGEDLLSRFRQQAKTFGAQIMPAQVFSVNFENDIKTVLTMEQPYRSKTVIVATGSMGHQATLKGESELLGKGVSYCAICDAAFFKDEAVAVLGELPNIFHELDIITKFAHQIYLFLKGSPPTSEQLAQLQNNAKLKLMHKSHLVEILGHNQVEGIRVKNQTGREQILKVSGVFVFLHGNQPVVDFLGDAIALSDTGCIQVDLTDMSTSIPGVYAVGDVTCKEIRQAIIAAAEGCIAALSADKYLHNRRKVKSQWS